MFAMLPVIVKIVWRNRHLLRPLVIQEFRQRYAGSIGGLAWAFINPIITLGVLWLVMGYGLRLDTLGLAPFFVVLLCKFLPWLTFSDASGAGVGAILSRSYLVKKIAFPLEVLPLVSIGLAAMVHVVLVTVFVIALMIGGREIPSQIVTLPYFFLSMLLLLCAINFLFSMWAVFVKDLVIAVPTILNIWFWLTPIVWLTAVMPEDVRPIIAANPMTMIVEGYSYALLNANLPDNFGQMNLFFWLWVAVLLTLGSWIFERLKPHIADTL